jgi:hypothetical protein
MSIVFICIFEAESYHLDEFVTPQAETTVVTLKGFKETMRWIPEKKLHFIKK